jgi:nucleoside-diphosphate-sugar epimerase
MPWFGSNHYGILNWFIHNALTEKRIEIYGDGSQQRDFISIQDLTELFSRSMVNQSMYGKTFNTGGGVGISLMQAAEIIIRYVPDAQIVFKPWPEIDKKIETGDYISDIQLLKEEIGWQPTTTFEDGIRETIKFYEGKSNG